MSLQDQLMKNTTLTHTAQMDKSKVYGKGDMVHIGIPIVDIALSGMVDGGLPPGLLSIAGLSRHFKSMFALMMAAAYLRKHEDGIILFYDSEFGTNKGYFDMFGIPEEKIVHCPITDIEELRHDIMVQLKDIKRGDHVFILVDSVGNLASRKEVDDAISGSEKADMTRAKVLKSLFRMVTPHLTIKDVPMVVIQHIYMTMEMFSKPVMSGGQGGMLASNAVWIIGRQQDKDGKELEGYRFIINIEKSRYVREKSKLPVEVNFETGINKWSGMLDLALELGVVEAPTKGYYSKVGDTKKHRRDDIADNDAFWEDIMKTTDFKERIKARFTLGGA